MGVRIQMFLTIFIVAVALGAEPELQLRTINFRPAADCALVLGDSRIPAHIPFKLLPSVNLLRIQMHHIARRDKEHSKI